MKVRAAMDETMRLALPGQHLAPTTGPLSMKHLMDMHVRAQSPEMSEGKLNRWLGWMQAAVVSWGDLTLDDMKEINRKHAND